MSVYGNVVKKIKVGRSDFFFFILYGYFEKPPHSPGG